MWCCPHLKRKLIVVGGRKRKKRGGGGGKEKKRKEKKTVQKKMGLGWIFSKFYSSVSPKPCQEVSKIQKVGKKEKEKEKQGTRFCEA